MHPASKSSVFWPGISTDIRRMVKNCGICGKHQPAQAKLPIMQPDLPTRQWKKLGTDIFEVKGWTYLMIVLRLLLKVSSGETVG